MDCNIYKQWRIYTQKFLAHASPLPPYGTKFFHFHVHFHQKAPASEVHIPLSGPTPPREILDLQNAFYRFSSTGLCTILLAGFSAVCWFSCFLSCRARNVRWFGGIVVRGCASRSLLGSYVHQESS